MSQEKKLKFWKMAVENVEKNWDMENDRSKESKEEQLQEQALLTMSLVHKCVSFSHRLLNDRFEFKGNVEQLEIVCLM